MAPEESLAWVEPWPSGRFGRIDGIVVAMAPEPVSHYAERAIKAARCIGRPAPPVNRPGRANWDAVRA